ncbi:MAG: twin-arginine translocase TatA/TatE family subunit [Phycisphaerae bacterium]|jgi:sec-independent protein translocase protein TatA|nr:twin-arginine translocase TatA/TatE family subunit [Phycisphaerae bacterium]
MNLIFEPIAWVPGPMEIVIIGLVALLIFGKRIPDLAKSLGRSIVEFKKGLHESDSEDTKALGNDQADILPPPEKRNNHTAH